MKGTKCARLMALFSAITLLAGCDAPPFEQRAGLRGIPTSIVISTDDRSFGNTYGFFPSQALLTHPTTAITTPP